MALHRSTYYGGDDKPVLDAGSYEYLVDAGRRMVERWEGIVEVRDAHGTLKASIWNEGDEIKVWENE